MRAMVIRHLMGGPAKSIGARAAVIARRLPAPHSTARWLVVGAEAGAAVVGDDQLAKACAKFGPGCTVVDLQSATADVQRRAS